MDLPPADPGPAPAEERPESEPAAPEPEPSADAAAAPETPDSAAAGRSVRRVLRERRRPLIVALVAAVVVVALAGSRLVFAPGAPDASPGTAAPSTASASAVGSASVAPSPTPEIGPSASATVGATESLPAQTAPTAEITFTQLVLDRSANGLGSTITLGFVSDGPGLVSVSVVATSPTDRTRVCLSGDGGTPICATGATPAATFYGVSSQSRWSATLESAGANPPTIDVAVQWPANKPSVSIAHSPFAGEPNRDSLRSVSATLAARQAGTLTVQAAWTPVPLTASLTVWRLESGGRARVDGSQYEAARSISPAHATPLEPGKTYQVVLINLSAAGEAIDLEVTIGFP